MRRGITLVLAMLCGIALADERAEAFFERYVALGNAFDASVAELCADDARIWSRKVDPHGTEQTIEVSGQEWKALIQRAMPIARQVDDRNIYTNVRIARKGHGYRIEADRYSMRKCYSDPDYFMRIAPDEKGELRIVEESLRIQPESECGPLLVY